MFDFWYFWDQTNCPYYRGVRKERLDCPFFAFVHVVSSHDFRPLLAKSIHVITPLSIK